MARSSPCSTRRSVSRQPGRGLGALAHLRHPHRDPARSPMARRLHRRHPQRLAVPPRAPSSHAASWSAPVSRLARPTSNTAHLTMPITRTPPSGMHVTPLGTTITTDAVRAELASLGEAEFRRSRLCQATTQHHDPVVSLEVWESLYDEKSARGESLTLAFDSTPDGSSSAIAVASKRADGKFHVEVIGHARGTGWLAQEVTRLAEAHHPDAVLVDPRTPAGSVIPYLRDQGVRSVESRASTPPRPSPCSSMPASRTNFATSASPSWPPPSSAPSVVP